MERVVATVEIVLETSSGQRSPKEFELVMRSQSVAVVTQRQKLLRLEMMMLWPTEKRLESV